MTLQLNSNLLSSLSAFQVDEGEDPNKGNPQFGFDPNDPNYQQDPNKNQNPNNTDDDNPDPNNPDPNNPNPEDPDNGGDPEGEDTVVNTIVKTFGVDTGKQYSNTEEGLAEYANDVVEAVRQQALEEEFTRIPLLKAFKDHIEQGRGVDTFLKEQQRVDFTKIKLNEEDDNQLKQVITQRYKAEGLNEKTIARLVKNSEEEGILFEDAKESLQVLSEIQEQEIEQERQRELQIIEQQRKEVEKAWKEAKEIVSKGKLLNLSIPATEKTAFVDFIEKRDRAGKTGADKAWETLTMEQRLFIDYLLYKGLKIPTVSTSNSGNTNKGTLGAGSRMFKTNKNESPGNQSEIGSILSKIRFGGS